jgi:hypothetical protein
VGNYNNLFLSSFFDQEVDSSSFSTNIHLSRQIKLYPNFSFPTTSLQQSVPKSLSDFRFQKKKKRNPTKFIVFKSCNTPAKQRKSLLRGRRRSTNAADAGRAWAHLPLGHKRISTRMYPMYVCILSMNEWMNVCMYVCMYVLVLGMYWFIDLGYLCIFSECYVGMYF